MNDERDASHPAPSIRYDSADKAPREAAPRPLGRADIAELAERYRIPLYDDPGVIDAFARLDAGVALPPELYGVMSDVLGFIHGLDDAPARDAAAK